MAENRQSLKLSALIVALAFAVMVTVNALANALPLNGVNTGQLSDAIPNLFVPAGLTFAIWGLIYALLLGYTAAILAGAFRKATAPGWDARDGWFFALNAVFNAAWIFAWHWRQIPLSFALMAGILITLIVLMERNYRSFGALGPAVGTPERIRRFFIRVPILVYLGWICVATIANLTALLVTWNWNGFGLDPRIWTIIAIAAGALVGSLLVLRRGAIASGLVVVWAYAGIILKRNAVDPQATMAIIVAAAAGAAFVLLAIGVRIVNERKRASP